MTGFALLALFALIFSVVGYANSVSNGEGGWAVTFLILIAMNAYSFFINL
jgi:hypothetical protein